MPGARGNQPMSSGSNQNQSRNTKPSAPRRNKKAPYRKAPRKPENKKRAVDNKQSNLINSLSRQMYKMQMATYGSVQQNLQSLHRDVTPTASAPICLDLTDFTCERVVAGVVAQNGGRAFQATSVSPYYTAVSKWKRNSTILNNYYWKNNNADQPDTGKYLCMSASYFIEVTGIDSLDNTRIRFDVIAQKPQADLPINVAGASTPQTPRVLPFTLAYLTHIAEPHINRINPTYFKKYFSKTVFINSSKTDPATKGTTANIQRFSFKIKPNKVMSQVLTNPQVGDVPIIDETTGVIAAQEEIPYGNYGPYNVSPLQPLWLLISTDDQVATLSDKVAVKISRRVVWRDHVGSSNL